MKIVKGTKPEKIKVDKKLAHRITVYQNGYTEIEFTGVDELNRINEKKSGSVPQSQIDALQNKINIEVNRLKTTKGFRNV